MTDDAPRVDGESPLPSPLRYEMAPASEGVPDGPPSDRAVPRSPLRARRGLTLIEAAVTVGMVAIVAIPASRMWLSMAQANVATDRQTKALVLAQLVLESKVRVVPYDQQQAGTGHDADGDLDWALTLTPVATGLRRAEVVVTDPADAAPVLRLAALSAKEN